MKNIIFGFISFIIIFTGCVGNQPSISTATSSAVVTDGMTLDQALAEAARRIEERITAGSKIAPLNFNSSSDRFSVYVLDELTANLVENGKLIVVDRSEIDLIRSEFDFQYSGDVGDDSMQALGRMLGAQSIISGSLTDMGGFYRIMIRVLNVQNASVEVQYRTNIVSDHVVAALLTGGRTAAAATVTNSGQTQQTTQPQSTQAVQTPQTTQPQPTQTVQTPQTTQPQSQQTVQTPQTGGSGQAATVTNDIAVPGANLAAKLQWLQTNAASDTHYLIELNGNESIGPQTLSYTNKSYITIRIVGAGRERIISLSSNGSLFTVGNGVTLILDNNITLRGRSGNEASLVKIMNEAELIMNTGSKVSGNTTTSGGGVYIDEHGSFTMTGGEISGNTASAYNSYGGGVYVAGNGSLNMTGGRISTNNSIHTGGYAYGGGVHIATNGIFTMSGGEISGNNVSGSDHYNFGGGVYVDNNGRFSKTGGIIYGYTESNIEDISNNNRSASNNGHAVYVGTNPARRRQTTAGVNVRMDSRVSGAAGGWEN